MANLSAEQCCRVVVLLARGKYKSDFFLFRHDLFLGFLYFVMTDICNIFYLVANALFLIQYGHLRFFKLKLIKLTSRPF